MKVKRSECIIGYVLIYTFRIITIYLIETSILVLFLFIFQVDVATKFTI